MRPLGLKMGEINRWTWLCIQYEENGGVWGLMRFELTNSRDLCVKLDLCNLTANIRY